MQMRANLRLVHIFFNELGVFTYRGIFCFVCIRQLCEYAIVFSTHSHTYDVDTFPLDKCISILIKSFSCYLAIRGHKQSVFRPFKGTFVQSYQK